MSEHRFSNLYFDLLKIPTSALWLGLASTYIILRFFKITNLNSSEIHQEMQSPRTIPSPVLVDISKRRDKSKEKLLLTPQKRQPRQPQVETPSKRRRVSVSMIDKFIIS